VGQCPTWWRPCRIQVAPSVQCCKVWLLPTTRVPCSNAAKKRNPLKFAGVPQTHQQISAVSRPKFTILSGHLEEVFLFNKFFFRSSIPALVPKIEPDKVVRWCQNGDFLRPVFPVRRVQHISHLHPKFALGPHYVWKYGRHPISGRWDYARKKIKEKKKPQGKNIMACPIP